MRIRKSVIVALKCGNHKGSPGVLTNGTDTWDRQKSRNRQHGFVLFVSCVLSVVAIIFAVDFFAFGSGHSPHGPRQNTAHQIDGNAGIPAPRQTAITSPTIRAILTEANWAKNQSVYPSGGDKALLGKLARLELNNNSQTPVFLAGYMMTGLRLSHTNVRAPPHAI